MCFGLVACCFKILSFGGSPLPSSTRSWSSIGLLGTLETSTTTILDPDALAKPTASSTESGARSVSTSFAGGKTLPVGIDELPGLLGSSHSTSVLGPTDEAGIAFGTGARRSLGSNEYGVSSSSYCGT